MHVLSISLAKMLFSTSFFNSNSMMDEEESSDTWHLFLPIDHYESVSLEFVSISEHRGNS
jgi:hypothetical protein